MAWVKEILLWTCVVLTINLAVCSALTYVEFDHVKSHLEGEHIIYSNTAQSCRAAGGRMVADDFYASCKNARRAEVILSRIVEDDIKMAVITWGEQMNHIAYWYCQFLPLCPLSAKWTVVDYVLATGRHMKSYGSPQDFAAGRSNLPTNSGDSFGDAIGSIAKGGLFIAMMACILGGAIMAMNRAFTCTKK